MSEPGLNAATAPSVTTGAPSAADHHPEVRHWITQIAYDIWERRGQPHGDDVANWLRAEKFVLAQVLVLGGMVPSPGGAGT